VCDVIFHYPENFIKGFFVTGSKGFKLSRQDVFIPYENIIKIGEDVVLTNFEGGENPPPKPPKKQKNCPPSKNCEEPQNNCQPQNNCPPQNNPCQPQNNCPPQNCCGIPKPPRNFDEYE
jgi:hypothetical protein